MEKYMTVAQMGEMLGLKKTDRYWLIHKNLFETKKLAGKTVVVVSSFENWYANQVKYHKINGTEPGLELRKHSYSARDISILLNIHEQTAYDLIRKTGMKTILVDGWKRVPKEEFDRWLSSQLRYRLHDFSGGQSEKNQKKSEAGDEEKGNWTSSEGAMPEEIPDFSNSVESSQNRSKSTEVWQRRPNSAVVKQNETDGTGLKQSCPENEGISQVILQSRPGYFTRKEAAAFAGVSETLIYLWAAEGHFSERKVGKKKYIPEGEFKTWLVQRREGGNKDGDDHKKKR